MNLAVKIALSALLIGLIAELGRRQPNLGALLAALPLVSVIAMCWIYHDTHDTARLAEFSRSVVWYVIPSLVLFILLPVLLERAHLGFYPALGLSCLATVAAFVVFRAVLLRFGVVI